MNNVEKQLAEAKKHIDSITAPEELEERLRGALDHAPPRKPKRMASLWKLAAVVSLCFIIFVGYHYNAFAFYGKKLFGFDEVMNGTLTELNNEGMGQIVEKKTELEDGTEFTINGIMTDANQLIMYYTLTNPDGLRMLILNILSPSSITGFLTDSVVRGGSSLLNEAGTELKGTIFFDPVSPFSKTLTVHFQQHLENGQMTEKTISFPYDPNQAMQTQIKQSIKKTMTVDKGTVTFDSITATPTSTVIEGTLNVENFDRVHFALGGIQLLANGTPIDLMGGGSQSSLTGMKFDIHFDALPEQLDSLELVMNEFVGYQRLEETISLASMSEKPILLGEKELWIKDVSTTFRRN